MWAWLKLIDRLIDWLFGSTFPPHPFIIILCFHVFRDVFYALYGFLHFRVPVSPQGSLVVREAGTSVWYLAGSPAQPARRLLGVEGVGVGRDAPEPDVGVLLLLRYSRGQTLPGAGLLGVLWAGLATDAGRTRVPHEQEGGQTGQEDALDPVGHVVRGRGAVVHVEDAHGAHDGEGDQHHGEHQVFAWRKGKKKVVGSVVAPVGGVRVWLVSFLCQVNRRKSRDLFPQRGTATKAFRNAIRGLRTRSTFLATLAAAKVQIRGGKETRLHI